MRAGAAGTSGGEPLKYVPIPIALLEVGQPLPVDIWSANGQLLLRKGQPVVSEQHKEKLHAHNASATPSDAHAWQRAYERTVHTLLRDGMGVHEIETTPMPSVIQKRDYAVSQQFSGGWLDLQEVLRGILYQGGLAINPLPRLQGVEKKALSLLNDDPDDSLFCLIQALAEDSLGYCATHALLCAVVCELTARKLGLEARHRQSLLSSAMTMNIGMARDQDCMARQRSALSEFQQTLVQNHPQLCVNILTKFGIDDADQLDLVRWHHAPDEPQALPRNLQTRRILSLVDGFVARLAKRKTRASVTPFGAAQTLYIDAEGELASVVSAMVTAVGFYPPGSYVQLVNGEVAVSVQRTSKVSTPWVICLLDKQGMPLDRYVCKDTAQAAYAIAKPVNPETIRVTVNVDKVRRARDRIAF